MRNKKWRVIQGIQLLIFLLVSIFLFTRNVDGHGAIQTIESTNSEDSSNTTENTDTENELTTDETTDTNATDETVDKNQATTENSVE